MDQDEERRIIAQVCAGDANAFEALVVAYQKQVYNLALRTVGNEEDAADMTQEVFLRAYRALGTFRGESKFSVWLYRLTTNVCIDFLRSRRRHPTVSLTAADEDDEQPQFDIPADEASGPEQQLARSELRRAVVRGLDQLPARTKVYKMTDSDRYSTLLLDPDCRRYTFFDYWITKSCSLPAHSLSEILYLPKPGYGTSQKDYI